MPEKKKEEIRYVIVPLSRADIGAMIDILLLEAERVEKQGWEESKEHIERIRRIALEYGYWENDRKPGEDCLHINAWTLPIPPEPVRPREHPIVLDQK